MVYIKPKVIGEAKATWKISPQAKAVVTYYANYTGYSEDEIVDKVLLDLRNDPDFINWLESKRRNKRAMARIFPEKKEDKVG